MAMGELTCDTPIWIGGQYAKGFPPDAMIRIGPIIFNTNYNKFEIRIVTPAPEILGSAHHVFLTNRPSGVYSLNQGVVMGNATTFFCWFKEDEYLMWKATHSNMIPMLEDGQYSWGGNLGRYEKDGKGLRYWCLGSRIGDNGFLSGGHSIYYAHTDERSVSSFAEAMWDVLYGEDAI